MGSMACKYFSQAPVQCGAVAPPVIPSLYERERFCTSSRFTTCPTYQRCTIKRSPISQLDYYGLWLGTAQLRAPAAEIGTQEEDGVPPLDLSSP